MLNGIANSNKNGLWEEGSQVAVREVSRKPLPDRIESAYLCYLQLSHTISQRIGMRYGGRVCYKQCQIFHVFSVNVTMIYKWELEDI